MVYLGNSRVGAQGEKLMLPLAGWAWGSVVAEGPAGFPSSASQAN